MDSGIAHRMEARLRFGPHGEVRALDAGRLRVNSSIRCSSCQVQVSCLLETGSVSRSDFG